MMVWHTDPQYEESLQKKKVATEAIKMFRHTVSERNPPNDDYFFSDVGSSSSANFVYDVSI